MTASSTTTDSSTTMGPYRLIANLGHGGMADVFLAVVEGPDGSGFTKLAVVKRLRSHLAEDPEFVSMLFDEARVTARLSHPNVVQLFEVGHVDEQYFLAMEYLDGQPLHRLARRFERHAMNGGTPVPREVYFAIISDILAGLHHAHELADYDGTPLGVVHRDVTPHNVFVTYDGAVKVVDFGIAKAVGRVTQTQHGVVKGKIRYMSPEQAAGADIDRRTDIFAAGVILWNLATGGKLWGDRHDVAIPRALYSGDFPASPRQMYPEVPEAIDAICRRALARSRDDRYATAAEMRADLDAFIGEASADLRKTLVESMKELFERDREKVRAVLKAAEIKRTTSFAALKTAMPARRHRSRERRGSRSSSASLPSATAFAGAAAAPAKSAVPARAGAARRTERKATVEEAPPKRSRLLTTAIVAATVAAVVTIAARRMIAVTTGPQPPPRVASVRTFQVTTFVDGPKRRKALPAPVVSNLVSKPLPVRGAAPAHPVARETRPTHSPSHDEPAADAGTGSILDKADPWSRPREPSRP